jgi:hypothetical protein
LSITSLQACHPGASILNRVTAVHSAKRLISRYESHTACLYALTNETKCDLAQPTCGKCVRSGKSCQFPNLVDGRSPNTRSTLSYPNDLENPSLLSAVSGSDGIATPEHPSWSQVDVVSWDDLGLLHHFLTVTYATLATRNDLRQMWQIEIPKLALKQKFLMHSLVSVTALHIASLHPENQPSYIDTAIRHHNIALREYSHKLHGGMTRENSPSMFACATLIVIFALNLAVSKPHKEATGPIEEMLGIFKLLRDVPIVLGEMWDWVRESEIAPMFAGRELDNTIILPDDVANAIKLLEEQNELSSSRSERDIYTLAIQGVKDCFKLTSSNDRDNGMVLSWPISVSQEYIALLGSRQQMALVILAHYAVILNEIKDTWWAMGWGSKLIQEVHQVLDCEWKVLIAWPMDKTVMRRRI